MVKMQGKIYDQLVAMDPKFVLSDYGLRDRFPESYNDYLSSATTPPPVVPASPTLEPALGQIPLDTAYLDSTANAAGVASMWTPHHDDIASIHLTIPEIGEDSTLLATHPGPNVPLFDARPPFCPLLFFFFLFCNRLARLASLYMPLAINKIFLLASVLRSSLTPLFQCAPYPKRSRAQEQGAQSPKTTQSGTSVTRPHKTHIKIAL